MTPTDDGGGDAEPLTFTRAIGMVRIAAADGESRWELTVEPRHLNRGAVAHGGVLATLADTAIGAAVSTVRRDGETWQIAVDLSVVFLEPARLGERLIAEGRVVRRGGRMAYGEATVRRDDTWIARGHSSYVIFEPRRE